MPKTDARPKMKLDIKRARTWQFIGFAAMVAVYFFELHSNWNYRKHVQLIPPEKLRAMVREERVLLIMTICYALSFCYPLFQDFRGLFGKGAAASQKRV
jgi:hypothetical protein